ncbi:MAG: TolC family protein [Elusimicrobiota bacterium]
MKKIILIIIVICFFYGQVPVSGETLTWNDVLKKALDKNPRMANARLSLQISDIAYRNSLTNFYPDISGSAGMRKTDSNEPSYSYGINASLNLFDGFKNVTDTKIKKRELSIEEAVYRRELSDFIYDLRLSFAKVLRARETIDLLEEIQKRRKNNMELVKLRYDAGREDRGAYLRSEADYLQSKFETREAKREYETVKADLLRNMGKEVYQTVKVTGTFNISQVKTEPGQKLLLENPRYVIAEYDREISKYNLKSRYGNLYPRLGLSGSLSRSGQEWPIDEDYSASFNLSLSHSFLNGGKDIYGIKTAKLNKKISDNSFEETRRKIMLDMKEAYDTLINAREQYEVRKKYFSVSRERSEIAKEKYLNGLISYQDWDSIENEFINARKSLIETEYSVFTAWAGWLNVTGRSLTTQKTEQLIPEEQ